MLELFGLVVGHFVGDFILQTDQQARLKATDVNACFLHVASYTFAVLLFTGWLFLPPVDCTLMAIAVFVPHFIIDHFRLARWFVENRSPGLKRFEWSVFVIDFTFHLVCLYLALILRGSGAYLPW